MNQIKPNGQAAESVVLTAGKNHGHRWGRAFAHNGLKSSVQNTARAACGVGVDHKPAGEINQDRIHRCVTTPNTKKKTTPKMPFSFGRENIRGVVDRA